MLLPLQKERCSKALFEDGNYLHELYLETLPELIQWNLRLYLFFNMNDKRVEQKCKPGYVDCLFLL